MSEQGPTKTLQISERIKALSAVPASSFKGDYKEVFVSMLADKY